MITAKKATPLISAAETIMLERISPPASGWRAIASMALAPILPIPIPAPMAAKLAPRAAPNFAKPSNLNLSFVALKYTSP